MAPQSPSPSTPSLTRRFLASTFCRYYYYSKIENRRSIEVPRPSSFDLHERTNRFTPQANQEMDDAYGQYYHPHNHRERCGGPQRAGDCPFYGLAGQELLILQVVLLTEGRHLRKRPFGFGRRWFDDKPHHQPPDHHGADGNQHCLG